MVGVGVDIVVGVYGVVMDGVGVCGVAVFEYGIVFVLANDEVGLVYIMVNVVIVNVVVIVVSVVAVVVDNVVSIVYL